MFGGSLFYKDVGTGKLRYMADSGDFISVSNVLIATLDLPIRGANSIDSRLFEGFVERMPAAGTPVTLILTPKVKARGEKGESEGLSLSMPATASRRRQQPIAPPSRPNRWSV